MLRCFECKQVNIAVEYECGSGVGDYFCGDCTKRNDYICPLCGSDMILIDNTSTNVSTENFVDSKSCPFCRKSLMPEWKYCPYCSKKL